MNDVNKKLTVGILLTNLFIAFLGIGLVIPVMPTMMNELGISGSIVGYLVAAFAFTQMLGSPFAGRWVDRYGRKPMILIGLFIFAFSEALFGLGRSVEVLFVSRILGGISAAFIMPGVTAFIADITSKHERAKALGYMSAAINTGFIVGPGIGGFLGEIATRLPFFAAAICGMIAVVISFLLLKEPDREAGDEKQQREKLGWKTGLRKMLQPLYVNAFALILIFSFGLASFESLFSLFVDHKFGLTPKDIAIIVTAGGLLGAIAQLFLFDRLTNKMGEIALTRYCLVLSVLLTLSTTMAKSYLSIMLISCVVFIGFDLIRPALTTYLSKVAGDEQGFVGGMNSMFTSLGNIFGPVVGGALFDMNWNYPFYFSALVLVIGFVISVFWRKRKNESVPTAG